MQQTATLIVSPAVYLGEDMTAFLKPLATGAAAIVAVAMLAQPAGEAKAAEPALETGAKAGAPAMWRVADADSEFILFGTFHFLKPGLDWRTEEFNAAFKKADSVYFEVEADAPDAQSKAVGIVMTQGFNLQGQLLTNMLEPADAAKLRDVARSLNLPIASIDPMRPWNAFLTLSVQFIASQGFEPGAGADSVLLAESRALGKELVFFETLEEQLALFTDLDASTERDLLVITLRDWDNQQAAFDDLFNAWFTGDVDFIDAQMNDAMRDQAPIVHERILVARNKAWAETLDAALKNGSGSALVAVGAGHLVGDGTSVPDLLAAKGYEVSRYGAANDNTPTP